MADFPIKIDLGLARLAEVFGEQVSAEREATRIRKRAHAEADANVIRVEGEYRAAMRVRGLQREEAEQIRRLENLDAIAAKTAPLLTGPASDKPIDPDWRARFLDAAQDVSNEDMQTIWAKIAAGEASAPGSFSLRTLRLVQDLQARDAELFTRFCAFVWHLPRTAEKYIPFIGIREPKLLEPDLELSHSELWHLRDIGLIAFESFAGFTITFKPPQPPLTTVNFLIAYYGTLFRVELPAGQTDIGYGHAELTRIGKELAPISGSQPDVAYRDKVLNIWRANGITVSEPPRRDESDEKR